MQSYQVEYVYYTANIIDCKTSGGKFFKNKFIFSQAK